MESKVYICISGLYSELYETNTQLSSLYGHKAMNWEHKSERGVLSITSTLHVYHTVLGALSGTTLVSREADLLPVECLQWCSPRMPCCRRAVGALQASVTFYTGVFSLSGFPPLVLACSLLDTEGSQEEKTKWGEGAGTGINCPSQGSI